MDIKERLALKLNERVKKIETIETATIIEKTSDKNYIQTVIDSVYNKKNEATKVEDLPFFKNNELDYIDSIIEENDLREFLKYKTCEIFVADTLSKLYLGKILNDVFEKIGNYKNGAYTKWVIATGLNERTALRYRNRFLLFDKVSNETGKETILKLSNEDIENIMTDENREKRFLKALEEGANKLAIKELLTYSEDTIEENESIKKIQEFSDVRAEINNLTRSVENNWENINKKKQRQISKLFYKIKQIINS